MEHVVCMGQSKGGTTGYNGIHLMEHSAAYFNRKSGFCQSLGIGSLYHVVDGSEGVTRILRQPHMSRTGFIIFMELFEAYTSPFLQLCTSKNAVEPSACE